MGEIYNALLRTALSKGRLAGIAVVSALAMLLGLAVGLDDNPFQDVRLAGYSLITGIGLSLLAPITALVFGSAVLGDPAEEGTLVYLWMRPVPRWHIATAAMGVVLTVTIPLAVIPIGISAMLTGGGRALSLGSLLASFLAVSAYGALFIGFGLLVRRALVWGLIYVLLWEGIVASVGAGPARLSVRLYTQSLLAEIANVPRPEASVDVWPAAITLVGIALAGMGLALWRLRAQDIV